MSFVFRKRKKIVLNIILSVSLLSVELAHNLYCLTISCTLTQFYIQTYIRLKCVLIINIMIFFSWLVWITHTYPKKKIILIFVNSSKNFLKCLDVCAFFFCIMVRLKSPPSSAAHVEISNIFSFKHIIQKIYFLQSLHNFKKPL